MRYLIAAVAVSLALQPAFAKDNPLINGESWDYLKPDFVDVPPKDGSALFEVDAPYRANDAATVPIAISQPEDATPIERATVIIDENPAPMAADLRFSPAMQPLDFELRVRVDQYSNVRVLAEAGGETYMNGRFVKASGGCSAPASRDPEVALASMGQMRLRHFDDTPMMSGQRREAQIMIRHPNYSGLQRDQITQLFISAHFIDKLEVFQGDEVLFTLEGGISVSENPVFRFFYRDNGAESLRVRAHDTEGNVFEQELQKSAES
ncbi:quinoprotein dehydrogenase-associated SoxYZ-like carrier [Sulfitobacter sp. D35]|uniref:quinoprotein dehydrogenase-associated SoxYZ-like carrier n=1 Tax=Sulfitobacter sp. D35 TaxID=3083252 RepID=UPI00296FE04B|nr:quinoprotein dehydrogenase-associated SoxYZ-like carrier [Sulfitobacter sp. D35]MDW4498637.1 quinoprotein dehydrogenase-associated SoxYZ-like carrier [Sulfitobacter sp. D35]